LRDAVANANALAGADTIQFDTAGVFATPQTINLAGALPAITDDLTINGPGAGQLTVRRDTGGDYRIFTVMVNAPGVVTISGLTITNGLARGDLPDDNIGGGIAILSNGTANISGCVLTDNSVGSGGYGLLSGGGIVNEGTLNVIQSTLTNNTAPQLGGGIFNTGNGTLNVIQSTLSNNSAGGGGAISTELHRPVTLMNSTVTANVANFGGGIWDAEGNNDNDGSSNPQEQHPGVEYDPGFRPGSVWNNNFTRLQRDR
jgi:hypothetical protein